MELSDREPGSDPFKEELPKPIENWRAKIRSGARPNELACFQN